MASFLCYCGSGKAFISCCDPLICGVAFAQTPEQLMRSRYSAYCHHDKNPQCYDYILQTYHSKVRPEHSQSDIADFAKAVRFIRLKILDDASLTTNQVHFVATYLVGDKLEVLDEVSDFELEQGHWMYCSGVLIKHPSMKLSRNDVCPCGSGVKFKKCQHPLQACN
ncbi:YchJ family protein [Rheinheimera sp.]|uniref:YchJ family protein n=1 Tax=Rheinheimera sp. TaxID=1869214 RepID=UPI0026372D73|nr:YchJ family metal-binding protein [Rheinheimera sp.]MCA1929813.1 SEC-C domain-containing protein [Rheinheimera sp.]